MIQSSFIYDSITKRFLLRNKDETKKADTKKEVKTNKITFSLVMNQQVFIKTLDYVIVMNRETLKYVFVINRKMITEIR